LLSAVIADAGPLIALSKLELLNLLPSVFSRILIPGIVVDEASIAGQPGSKRLDEFFAQHLDFIEVLPTIESPEILALSALLGRGEIQAIEWAIKRKHPVFVDDRRARIHATSMGVSVLGVGGFLIKCKEMGLVPAVAPLLEQLQAEGYFLSDALLKLLVLAAKE
jgi:uncharacterized protein